MRALRIRLQARRTDERGAVAIMVAAIAVVLFLVAALVVDLGLARDTKRQAQNAADASALAAANVLYPASGNCQSPVGATAPCFVDAISAARSYAAVNYGVTAAAWTNCVDGGALPHRPDSNGNACISFDEAATPSQVRVVMPPRTIDTGLGQLAGIDTITVAAAARAAVKGGPARSCGLCFLNSVDAGNADFTVSPGGIMVNGNLSAGPNSTWTAGTTIGVVGTVSGGQFAPAVTQTVAIPDPLATIAMPAIPAANKGTNSPCGTAASAGPGKYGSLELPNSACALQPGTYVVTGTWGMKNNTNLTGTGVTIYVLCGTSATPRACNANEAGGKLDFKNGNVAISAPTSGANAGKAIIYDRNNTQDLELQGNGGTSITGMVYLKSGTLSFNGNSCFQFSGGPVVAGGVTKANGNKSCVRVINSTDAQLPAVPGEIALDQ